MMYKTFYLTVPFLFMMPLVGCKSKHSKQAVTVPTIASEKLVSLPTNFPGWKFYKWQLNNIVYAKDAPQQKLPKEVPLSRFHMRIGTNSLFVQGACNYVNAKLHIQANNQVEIARMMMTQRGCLPLYEQADQVLYTALQGVKNYQLSEKNQQFQLQLTTETGTQLHFQGVPTPERKYGKGTQRFIEIQGFTTPCKKQQCIQWREVHYSKGGGRLPNKDGWKTEFPGVEGFTVQHNRNYIVRLYEYKTPKGKIWIHDMTISVERKDMTPTNR